MFSFIEADLRSIFLNVVENGNAVPIEQGTATLMRTCLEMAVV